MQTQLQRFFLCSAFALGSCSAVLAAGPRDHAAPSLLRLDVSVTQPLANLQYQTEGVSSSAEIVEAGDPAAGVLSAGDTGQPPPRRRVYARSRYQDRLHNADGSTRIAFVAGAGATVPLSDTSNFYTPHYAIFGGAGYNFNRAVGILGEFHYDRMGTTTTSLNTEYSNLIAIGATPAQLAGFDGNAHVIAFTLNPIFNIASDSSPAGAYVTGGVGFYHKATNFTLPVVATSCNSFYCQQYLSNYNIDTASANAFGLNIGFGLSYKISQFSSERIFAEARYTRLNIKTDPTLDFFPYNRRNTDFIPVTVGIRF